MRAFAGVIAQICGYIRPSMRPCFALDNPQNHRKILESFCGGVTKGLFRDEKTKGSFYRGCCFNRRDFSSAHRLHHHQARSRLYPHQVQDQANPQAHAQQGVKHKPRCRRDFAIHRASGERLRILPGGVDSALGRQCR